MSRLWQIRLRPQRLAAPAAAAAFSLLELLVVMAIIALLIGILVPALGGSRTEGAKLKCLSNLRSLGQAFAAYTVDDERDYTSPVHPKAEASWYFDGEYEYGGKTGLGVMGAPDWRQDNRILNRYLYGTGGGTAFALYECPGDGGIPALDPSDGWVNFDSFFLSSQQRYRPAHVSAGTSYRLNNHIDFTRTRPAFQQQHFFGPYLRPITRVPDPATTVLLAETVAEVAKWNPGLHVEGWHRKANLFNVLFVDTHAGAIFLSGHEDQSESYDGYWVARGDGWRLDCYPQPPILDLPRRPDRDSP